MNNQYQYPPNTKRISAKAYRKMRITNALDKMNTKQTNKVYEFIENGYSQSSFPTDLRESIKVRIEFLKGEEKPNQFGLMTMLKTLYRETKGMTNVLVEIKIRGMLGNHNKYTICNSDITKYVQGEELLTVLGEFT